MPKRESHQIVRLSLSVLLFIGQIAVLSGHLEAQEAAKLTLNKGDHVAYIGNTLADRMQHHAWLETLIHAQFPDHDLTFRNLGFAGDEITARPRSANFGSPDEWLAKCEADVVFCFFGFNEALRGDEGLAKFESDFAKMIDNLRSQKYNGQSSPKIVAFSPIAHENLNSRHLPDGTENNPKLERYTYAMQEICKAKNVPFVDLFAITRDLYSKHREPLTLNGIHLLDRGNEVVASEVMIDLFGNQGASTKDASLLRLRDAVLEKNDYWFSRYRVVDGYNVYGGRSKLNWHGQSNADVMKREMEIFDVMTANRDLRVWAVAKGGDLKVVDDNIPDELVVKTNKPGVLPGDAHPYVSPEGGIEKMEIHKGMKVNVFASEQMFPEMVNPVQMAVDTDGRLFASVWPSYPHWNPTKPRTDRIVCLPDEDGDGVADKCTVFADELNSITGFEFWGGGMLVAAPPEIWFLKDTDGDDKADVKIRMLQGVSSADTHHTANAMVIGADGGLYWSRGVFHVTNMETPTKSFRSTKTGVYRFDPRTFEIDFHFPIGPNPHGDVFDQWGYQFANDGTSGTGSYVNIGKGQNNKKWFKKEWRPVAATGILSGQAFPDELQGNFLICNTIGFLGVLQHKVQYDGADITCEKVAPILQSSDPNFRPTDVEIGGDGALYVSDWCNVLIGHMQHNMRDPNRDAAHGRIYRVTHENHETIRPYKLKGKSIAEVCNTFFAKENAWRYRARLELSGRPTEEVEREVGKWAATRDINNPVDAQALLECLWVFEEHRVPNMDLLRRVFTAAEPRVRAAAIRTLGHWGTKVSDWAPTLLAAGKDASALVRAEAVKAAVSFKGVNAAEVIFLVSDQKLDDELATVLKYAQSQIDVNGVVKEALASNVELSVAAQKFVLRNASINDLLKMERTEAMYLAILDRTNASASDMSTAIDGLAKLTGTNKRDLLLRTIKDRDSRESTAALYSLCGALTGLPKSQLAEVEDVLRSIALGGTTPEGRRVGFAGLIVADGSIERALSIAGRSKESLRDLLDAIPMVSDVQLRSSFNQFIRPLASKLPDGLASEATGSGVSVPGIKVDYFEPHPRNVSIETLASIKPNASGKHTKIEMNVPILKRRDAFALRFTGNLQIDKAGQYTFYSASDDGSRIYVDTKLVVSHDGNHGMSEKSGKVQLSAGMHSLVVTYFDSGGGDGLKVSYSGPGIKKVQLPENKLFVSGEKTLHDIAIATFALMPGQEAEKFAQLSELVQSGRSQTSAIHAIAGLPPESWAEEGLGALAASVAAYVADIPAEFRTQQQALEAMDLTDRLAAKLSAEQSRIFRAQMADLKVNVIKIGTVRERMIYDKERIVVQAGKPVQFILSNSDAMPHNFAITVPGALQEVGELGESTGRDKDAKQRQFIPRSNKILLSSNLLEPGETQSLTFEVPSEPGVYPYVCTYPGHWLRMFGAMFVVADLKEYEKNPEEYLANNPVPMKDEMLKYIDRDTEWTFEDLEPAVMAIADPDSTAGSGGKREYEVGKSLFKAAACISCHRMGKEGNEFGPELNALNDKKATLEHLLTSIVDPNKEIEEKYQTYAFVLADGGVVNGMIVNETKDAYSVIQNPLADTQPKVIAKDDIDVQKKLSVSTMPKGLLNKLSLEEILDLMAYVYAKGDKNHAVFK